jgi:hypothetical protein
VLVDGMDESGMAGLLLLYIYQINELLEKPFLSLRATHSHYGAVRYKKIT